MYHYRGKVKKGKQRGKKLGFPTANITLHKNIPEGIYLSLVQVEGKKYPSLTFIGAAKTFGETKVLSETYILSFDRMIYGKWIAIDLVKKIRDNQSFSSEEALQEQMRKDEQEARNYFSTG